MINEKTELLSIGDQVYVQCDQDGAAGQIGKIGNIYKSGRCHVDFPDGSFRSLSPDVLKAVK